VQLSPASLSTSTASLSGDDVVTTGLRVRRKRSQLSHEDSQEEYEESESEASSAGVTHIDDDDARTTVAPSFVPQPNIFSQEPNIFSHPNVPRRAQSFQEERRWTHTPIGGSLDHDAALRASLSTLLSCAAAARGLPKQSTTMAPTITRMRPPSIRLVSEEELEKPTKKRKRRERIEDDLAPTLLTWVVSAGVVVLVSAISFSAGYAMGREAGYTEFEARELKSIREGIRESMTSRA
jgi:hypothetical protein